MSKNDPITILDPDAASRDAIAAYLQAEGLAEDVVMADPQDFAGGGIVLSVQNQDDNAGRLAQADIFVKPVRFGALLERVNFHLLKKQDIDIPEFLEIGPFQLDWKNHLLMRGKTEIKMTEKETAILKLLYLKKGIVSREELLDKVWAYADGVETHTLETHIYRLRQKIEKDAANPKLLLTAENGYLLSR